LATTDASLLLQETINVGLKTDVVKTSEIAKINVDTTVQPKAIKYPTDLRFIINAEIIW
jgi:IS5 family transposase